MSPDTLSRLVRGAPEPAVTTPRVLGVDDWAKKKGQSYGTILVDLEEQKVIDLLDDRSSEGLAHWLQEHAGVEIISRDRGLDYYKGATLGAPQAIQVADRWHLLTNLRDALECLLTEKPACLQAAAEPPKLFDNAEDISAFVNVEEVLDRSAQFIQPATEQMVTIADKVKQARRARKQELFDLVRSLHKQGVSQREIGRQLGLSTNTIAKYIAMENCSFYPEGVKRGPSKLDAFLDYLTQRWHAGCHNGTQLWREIRAQGFGGSRPLVSRWAAEQRQFLPPKPTQKQKRSRPRTAKQKVKRWSASRAAWLLVKSEDALDLKERHALERIKATDESVARAYQLAHHFQVMIRQQRPEMLHAWLSDVAASKIAALISLANGIRQDFEAVRNALTLPWSQGQTEGQVNRLKFIKRQMFGRANFDLLRRRVLGCPALS
jgi:transposase